MAKSKAIQTTKDGDKFVWKQNSGTNAYTRDFTKAAVSAAMPKAPVKAKSTSGASTPAKTKSSASKAPARAATPLPHPGQTRAREVTTARISDADPMINKMAPTSLPKVGRHGTVGSMPTSNKPEAAMTTTQPKAVTAITSQPRAKVDPMINKMAPSKEINPMRGPEPVINTKVNRPAAMPTTQMINAPRTDSSPSVKPKKDSMIVKAKTKKPKTPKRESSLKQGTRRIR